MDMYPYVCEHCGGGFNRCGEKNCQTSNCLGSQFCWEDEAVLIIQETKINNYSAENVEEILSFSLEYLNIPIRGLYTGYGFFEVEDSSFLFFDTYNLHSYMYKDTENYISVKAFCKSCFKF